MKRFIADLHVHLGRNSKGKVVKVTASPSLTLGSIVEECATRKGVDLVGIVDCACPQVIQDLRRLIGDGVLAEQADGGLRHKDRVTLILGAEIETAEPGGGVAHYLAYFPYLKHIEEFSGIIARHITNPELSTQRATLSCKQLAALVAATGGVFVPAHAFTPHKSYYGNVAPRLSRVFGAAEAEAIVAVELGLSADTALADRITELEGKTFLTNSDAHSLAKIGREYSAVELERPTFKELMLALRRKNGRRVAANYGLDPRLGKYHRSFCDACNRMAQGPPPVAACEACGRSDHNFVKGVLDRIHEIGDRPQPSHPDHRPPYHYQIPLQFVPGVGPRTLDLLIQRFGSEMAVLHDAGREELSQVVGWEVSGRIVLAREGRLTLQAGGGGKYGKVTGVAPAQDQLALL